MRVLIGVGTHDLGEGTGRRVWWVGEVGWPSVPPVGATWVHCGGYNGERVAYVYYCGPGDDGEDQEGYAPVGIEIRTTDEVVQHLVEHHGFAE